MKRNFFNLPMVGGGTAKKIEGFSSGIRDYVFFKLTKQLHSTHCLCIIIHILVRNTSFFTVQGEYRATNGREAYNPFSWHEISLHPATRMCAKVGTKELKNHLPLVFLCAFILFFFSIELRDLSRACGACFNKRKENKNLFKKGCIIMHFIQNQNELHSENATPICLLFQLSKWSQAGANQTIKGAATNGKAYELRERKKKKKEKVSFLLINELH